MTDTVTDETRLVERLRSNLDEVSATITLYKSIIKGREDERLAREESVQELISKAWEDTKGVVNRKLERAFNRAEFKIQSLSDIERDDYIESKLKEFRKKKWIDATYQTWSDVRNLIEAQAQERNEKMASIIYEGKKEAGLFTREEIERERARIQEKIAEAYRNTDTYGNIFGDEDDIQELRQKLEENLAELNVRKYASNALLKLKLDTLIKKRDLLRIQLKMAEHLVIDVERDDKVKRIMTKVLRGIRMSQRSDQYYNIATDKPVAPGVAGIYYDTETKLAHNDQSELRTVVRLLRGLLTKQELQTPPQIKFRIKKSKTGEHRYAVIPIDLYNTYSGERPLLGEATTKELRVTAPKYTRFLQNYNAQFQPKNVISDEDIEMAFERLKIRHGPATIPSPQQRPVTRTAIVVRSFPTPEVVDVPVDSPMGKVIGKQVEVEIPYRYNVYVPARSQKDQEYSSQRAKFLGRYYKEVDSNKYVRQDAVDQIDEKSLIQRSADGYVLYARDIASGSHVRLPDFFSNVIFGRVEAVSNWKPAIASSLGGLVLYAKNPLPSQRDQDIEAHLNLLVETGTQVQQVRKMDKSLERFYKLMRNFSQQFRPMIDGYIADDFTKFFQDSFTKGEAHLSDPDAYRYMADYLNRVDRLRETPDCGEEYNYVNSDGEKGCTNLRGFVYPYDAVIYVKLRGVDHYVPIAGEEFQKIVMVGRHQYERVNDEYVVYNKYQIEYTPSRGAIQFEPKPIAGFDGFTG